MLCKQFILTFVFLILFHLIIAQRSTNIISGIVSDGQEPLKGVNISIKGDFSGTATDAAGRYVIEANVGDTLVFSHLGMKVANFVVEDVTKILNIEMLPVTNKLDEVVVTKKVRRDQKQLEVEFATNKEILKSSLGYFDKRSISGNIRIIDGGDLLPVGEDFLTSLQLHPSFFGRIDRESVAGPQVFVKRGYTSLSLGTEPAAIYDVDGTVTTYPPLYLNVEQIDRIAILSGPGATSAYGMRAVGGVVVVNTKSVAQATRTLPNSTYPYADNSNKFSGTAKSIESVTGAPKYMQDLIKSKSEKAALELFEKYKIMYGSSPFFWLNVFEHFAKKWEPDGSAAEILDKGLEKCKDDSHALKAWAYILEEQGNLDKALAVYKQILRLRPKYAQSYRDLGNLYASKDSPEKSYQIYARYATSRQIDTVTSELEGIDRIVMTEIGHLMSNNREVTTFGDKSINVTMAPWTVRIVLEWNNSEAEFDLQFVNPENRFFIWSHTRENNLERINDEKAKGYSMQQFLLDESIPGGWKININYKGNKGYDPTYLKTTIYKNYGTASEEKVLQVFKLTKKNVLFHLLPVNVIK